VGRAFYDEGGEHVKTCTLCKETLPVDNYYKHTKTGDGLRPRCRPCVDQTKRAANQRRAKKRKQKTHKLNEAHIKWIKEQQGKLSTRQVAKAFSKRFWAMKVTNSTVHRIFTGQIHAAPNKKDETLSVYDLLEQAQSYTGSVEDYIEEIDTKKVRF
jgi:hypothetical protein